MEKRTSTYINWKNPNVSSACFRKYVDSKNQNVATDSTWWIEFQVLINVIFKFFHFCQTAFLLFYFVLTQLRIISWNWVARQSRPFKSWADWELRRSAKLQLSQLWKFVLISLWILRKSREITMIILSDTLGFMASPCYKSQRIEEKMWKNSKKESELKYFQNVKSSVIVCRCYIHLFTVSNVNFLSNCCQWKEDW